MSHPYKFPLIRKFEDHDLPAVLEIYRQCEDFLALGPVPYASLEMVQQDLDISRQEGGVFCVIQMTEGKLAGIVDYIPHGFQGKAGQAFLSLLMIARPYRWQGLGKLAAAWVEDQVCKDPLVTVIYAGVQINNLPGLGFWQARGYKIVDGPTLQADRTITYLLKKDLFEAAG